MMLSASAVLMMTFPMECLTKTQFDASQASTAEPSKLTNKLISHNLDNMTSIHHQILLHKSQSQTQTQPNHSFNRPPTTLKQLPTPPPTTTPSSLLVLGPQAQNLLDCATSSTIRPQQKELQTRT
ncbi:hypothetical protein Droror1_Dr00016255 [Drosera rotundifolia]